MHQDRFGIPGGKWYAGVAKRESHGFCLHNAVQMLEAMGGTLTARRDGAEEDATFTLERVEVAIWRIPRQIQA